MAAAQAAENYRDEWGLTWYLYLILMHLSNDHEDRPNQHKNSHKLCDEAGHPLLSLLESQLKLKQQHDQNLQMENDH